MNEDTLLPDAKNPLIWINPERLSGVPCFYKTRLPIDSLFENLARRRVPRRISRRLPRRVARPSHRGAGIRSEKAGRVTR